MLFQVVIFQLTWEIFKRDWSLALLGVSVFVSFVGLMLGFIFWLGGNKIKMYETYK
jgi:hypothetical protein